MKRLMVMATLLAAVALPSAAFGLLGDELKITDQGTTAQIVPAAGGGSAVEVVGKYSGLGNNVVTAHISAPFSCTNNGGNKPPGQLSANTGPIAPSNGNITFDVTTNAANCPDHMDPLIGPTVTVTLTLADGSFRVFTYPV
ncbi:MAG TPA: hypothetical protein VF942_12770 [Acidimicrobiales bacterium]